MGRGEAHPPDRDVDPQDVVFDQERPDELWLSDAGRPVTADQLDAVTSAMAVGLPAMMPWAPWATIAR